jgi:membrane-bound lytic murein transglycosylase D
VNNLQSDDLTADSKLIIPMTASKAVSEGASAYSKKPTRYKVRKGDSVLTVADDFAVPAERVRRWNHLKGNNLRPGRTLVIYKPVSGRAEPEPRSTRRKASAKSASTHKKTTRSNAKAASPKQTTKKTRASGKAAGK